MTRASEAIHAGCVLIGEAGVLIRGASGAGKSRLGLALIERQRAGGGFAMLVADDRVRLERVGNHVIARPHPILAGLTEVRGIGLVRQPAAAAALVRLVVDLTPHVPPRLPDTTGQRTALMGIHLPCLALDSRLPVSETVAGVRIWLGQAGLI